MSVRLPPLSHADLALSYSFTTMPHFHDNAWKLPRTKKKKKIRMVYNNNNKNFSCPPSRHISWIQVFSLGVHFSTKGVKSQAKSGRTRPSKQCGCCFPSCCSDYWEPWSPVAPSSLADSDCISRVSCFCCKQSTVDASRATASVRVLNA